MYRVNRVAKHIVLNTEINLGGQVFNLPAAKAGKGRYVEILTALKNQLDAMLSYHCKVLVLRFDLHLNEATTDNALISRFMRKLRKRISVKFGINRFGFVWVREQACAKTQHYHLALYLNGNQLRHPHNMLLLIEDIWQRWGQPKPHTPQNCYYLLTRVDKQAYEAAFARLSYLAKVDTKGSRADATNDYSASRLKPKC